jgi:hypothetical protein
MPLSARTSSAKMCLDAAQKRPPHAIGMWLRNGVLPAQTFRTQRPHAPARPHPRPISSAPHPPPCCHLKHAPSASPHRAPSAGLAMPCRAAPLLQAPAMLCKATSHPPPRYLLCIPGQALDGCSFVEVFTKSCVASVHQPPALSQYV